MTRVLVTGGCGFVGSHLIGALSREGNEVVVLDHKKSPISGVKSFVGDIRNSKEVLEAAVGADTILHLAAQVSVPKSIEDPKLDAEVNALGTLNMLEAARSNNAKFVFSSSAAVYGDTKYIPIDEEHPQNPISPYGISKLVAEKYCLAYVNDYGIDAVITRFSNVFGPGNKKDVIYKFINDILQKRHIKLEGTGEQKRDFIYVKDVVSGVLAARTSKPGEIYNLSTGVGTTLNQLIGILRDILGDFKVECCPPRHGDIKDSVLSNKKACDVLGFRVGYQLEKAIKETIEWARNETS